MDAVTNKLVPCLFMLCAVLFLNGCIAAAAGAGVAGGYYVGKDERPLGQMTSDATTTSKIKTLFLRDPVVKAWDINVDTYNGEVTLKGRVATEDQRHRAEELTWTVKGVKAVTNHMAVVPY